MDQTTIFGIVLHFPSAQGIFNQGIFATIGFFLGYFFVAMILIWIGYSIYAGYKIMLSQGDEKEIETGMTLIKNVWVSISWGLVFFIALSIIGSLAGIGDVTKWNTQLAQCKGAAGGFYFMDRAAQQIAFIPTDTMYCCLVSGDIKQAADPYNELGFRTGTGHFIGTTGGFPGSGVFSECEKF